MRRNRRNSAPQLEQLDDRLLLSAVAEAPTHLSRAQVRELRMEARREHQHELRLARIQHRLAHQHLITPQMPFRNAAAVAMNTNLRAENGATAADLSAAPTGVLQTPTQPYRPAVAPGTSTDATPTNATGNPYYFPVPTPGPITPNTPIFDASPTASPTNPPVNATGNPYYHPVPTPEPITPNTPIFD